MSADSDGARAKYEALLGRWMELESKLEGSG